jgi:hypothetical protein
MREADGRFRISNYSLQHVAKVDSKEAVGDEGDCHDRRRRGLAMTSFYCGLRQRLFLRAALNFSFRHCFSGRQRQVARLRGLVFPIGRVGRFFLEIRT